MAAGFALAPDLQQTRLTVGVGNPQSTTQGIGAHRRPLRAPPRRGEVKKATRAPARNNPDPIAEAVQASRRYTVGTSGFGGRLYWRGSPRTINIACRPLTLVSVGS